MDVFARTFLPAAVEAGVTSQTVTRHLPVFSRCVAADDPAALVVRCRRPGQPLRGDFLLLLTSQRLVVTRESWAMRRLRLHLNAELRHLHNVSWTPDARLSGVEFAATAIDGVRERFVIPVAGPDAVDRLDALFAATFRPAALGATATARPAARTAPRRDLV
ncbi:MAG TPA: hypothetical protein VFT95_18900, partial [Micromonosporaceae bacterium]|nr:hypothetical protein [Micromonosporaceae bacterium]